MRAICRRIILRWHMFSESLGASSWSSVLPRFCLSRNPATRVALHPVTETWPCHQHRKHETSDQYITPSLASLCKQKQTPNAPMGIFCSINKGDESDYDKDLEGSSSHNSRQIRSQQHKMTDNTRKHGAQRRSPPGMFRFQFQDDMAGRADESALPEEAELKAMAKEAWANSVIARMRVEDEEVFENESLSPSQNFLDVRHLLKDTKLFHVAGMVPKGAHLHIHFNSTLRPGVLLGYAKDMANMYIWSDHRLTEKSDFENCKLEFSLRNLEQVREDMHKKALESNDLSMLERLRQAESMQDDTARTRAYDELSPDIFSPSYKNGSNDKTPQVEEMRYQYFRERWNVQGYGDCDEWLIRKLTFSKEEVQSFYFHGADEAAPKAKSDVDHKPAPVAPMQYNPQQPASNGESLKAFDEEEWIAETQRKISDSDYKHVRDRARQ